MNPTLRAALWMFGGVFAFSAMAVAGRAIAFDLDTFEIMMYRSFIGIALVLGFGAMFGTLNQITRRNLDLHVIRNVCHFTGQNLWFYALNLMPLAQLFALEFTTPLWVLVLSPFVLHEALSGSRILAAIVGFIGILIVARPGLAGFDPNLLYAAAASIGFAGSIVFTRKLTRTESITCILFYLTVLQAIFGVACAGYDGDIAWPVSQTWLWLVVIGCAGLFAHFCLTKAVTLAPAT
ncbi:MAG: DMT family transporter, partial [Pseudomonadota bacterium]